MIILAFIVIALVAGFIANWLVGRCRGYENWELFLAGIVGSFVGGGIFNLLAGNGFDIHWTGLVGSIIGAVVGVQPFGGEGLSGTGPKAGGPHALTRHVTERALSVNIAAQGGDPALLNL